MFAAAMRILPGRDNILTDQVNSTPAFRATAAGIAPMRSAGPDGVHRMTVGMPLSCSSGSFRKGWSGLFHTGRGPTQTSSSVPPVSATSRLATGNDRRTSGHQGCPACVISLRVRCSAVVLCAGKRTSRQAGKQASRQAAQPSAIKQESTGRRSPVAGSSSALKNT